MKEFLDRKIPGGIIIVPLFIGCLLNTFWPEVLQIGGFTTALATGSSALVGAFLVCMGANLSLRSAPKAIKTGLVVVFVKLFASIGIGLLISRFFDDNLFGISAMAVIAAMSNSNGAMFAALTKVYGDETDQGAVALVSLNDGPFFTMIALGTAGIASIPFMSLVIGIILGNLDPKMKQMLSNAGDAVIMLVGFSLGANMSLWQIAQGGLGGLLIGLCTVFVGCAITVFFDKRTGGTGISGAAISSTGGNAVATPMAIAQVDPTIAAAASTATPMVAASVIITAIFCPLVTAFVAKRNGYKPSDTLKKEVHVLEEALELEKEELKDELTHERSPFQENLKAGA